MLNCNDTITIYHKTYDQKLRDEVYTPTVIQGCSWFAKMQSSLADKVVQLGDLFTVRIPLENAPEELIFTKGDYVLKGEVLIEQATPKDLLKNRQDIFVIQSYTVNDKGSPHTRHIRISGS